MCKFKIRFAVLDDAKQLLIWRNEYLKTGVNGASVKQNLPSQIKWLNNALDNECFDILIAEYNNVAVGVVRIEKEHGCSILSWTVDSSFRGKGYGAKMVRSAIHQRPGPFCAVVRSNNIASIKIAKSIGLECVFTNGQLLVFSNDADNAFVKQCVTNNLVLK